MAASRPLLLLVILVACSRSRAPSPRERVLAALPADASAVFVADGKALSHARFRPVIDALRPRWPASLGCVIDAGMAADQVGIATTHDGTTIVMVGRVTNTCPALSKRGRGLWIATIGDGRVAEAGVTSVLDDPRFVRARKHLVAAPIAISLESARFKTRVHASAQPEPLEAWVAFDADPSTAGAVELGVRALVERMVHDSTTSALAAHVAVTRDESQIIARVGKFDGDLAATARTLVAWGWGVQASEAQPVAWQCPKLVAPVIGCVEGTKLAVSSLGAVADAIAQAPFKPIVSNGIVSGLRLAADLPTFGLARGDLVFACAGRPLVTQDQLVDDIRTGRQHQVMITVRRDTIDTKLLFDARR